MTNNFDSKDELREAIVDLEKQNKILKISTAVLGVGMIGALIWVFTR